MAVRVGAVALQAAEWSWTYAASDAVSAAAWRPQGDRILVGSLSGEAAVLDADRGEPIQKCPEHPFGTLDVAWSPDGERAATGGADGIVRVIDAAGRELGSSKGSGWVSRLEWSPKGTLLAAASGKELLVVDRDGQLVRRFAVPSTATDLVWSVDGSRVAVSAYGGVQWFLPDGPSDAAVKTMAWKGSILKMAQSATGAWLCHGNQDNSVHIWKVKSGDELEISGYPAKVDVLEFDGSGRWLAVGTVGHTSVWDCAGKGPRGRRPVACEGHSRRVTAVAWRPRTTTLASGSADGSVRVFDPSQGNWLLRGVEAGGDVTTLDWSPSGTHLLVGRGDGVLGCLSW